MKEMRLPRGIGMMLIGISLLFSFFYFQSALSAEVSPFKDIEANYPESLSEITDFHSSFIKNPASAMGINEFNPKVFNGNISGNNTTNPQASIEKMQLDPEIIFSENGPYYDGLQLENSSKDVMAINTDERNVVEEHRTIYYSDLPGTDSSNVNAMNIEVAHITVIAINFARGGKATATSEIYIQPIQDHGCASRSDVV